MASIDNIMTAMGMVRARQAEHFELTCLRFGLTLMDTDNSISIAEIEDQDISERILQYALAIAFSRPSLSRENDCIELAMYVQNVLDNQNM